MVVILMGSRSDMEHAQAIGAGLDKLGIAYELRIGSAHKTPAHVLDILRAYEADPRPKVYITIAGRSNALSGFVDAQVSAPVIACPPASSSFSGADIYSSLRMPGGVAPAVVLEPGAAALLAGKILGVGDAAIRQRIEDYQRSNAETILNDDAEMRQKV
jgi:5-(carboxyamino)imidazole ribonucleotide mutase/phosphoribosylaminoimidazole-succinocarboxamide synthase